MTLNILTQYKYISFIEGGKRITLQPGRLDTDNDTYISTDVSGYTSDIREKAEEFWTDHLKMKHRLYLKAVKNHEVAYMYETDEY